MQSSILREGRWPLLELQHDSSHQIMYMKEIDG